VQRRLRVALGTFVAIEAQAPCAATALAGVEAGFAAVADVDARMHPESEGSDVRRINSAAPGTHTVVHESTWQVLALSQRFHAITDGIFDPCLPERPGRLGDLELSRADGAPASRWVSCHAPLALDLGGIAKGYAVDRAIEALVAAGCSAGLVNAGGDLRLFGARRERILLRRGDGSCEPLTLANTALAVSEARAERRPPGHRGYYVRGRAAAAQCEYVAVLASAAVLADALSKCVLLCPQALARRALREFAGRSAPVTASPASARQGSR
jgi:thiamine biosynthesis lipoprotein